MSATSPEDVLWTLMVTGIPKVHAPKSQPLRQALIDLVKPKVMGSFNNNTKVLFLVFKGLSAVLAAQDTLFQHKIGNKYELLSGIVGTAVFAAGGHRSINTKLSYYYTPDFSKAGLEQLIVQQSKLPVPPPATPPVATSACSTPPALAEASITSGYRSNGPLPTATSAFLASVDPTFAAGGPSQSPNSVPLDTPAYRRALSLLDPTIASLPSVYTKSTQTATDHHLTGLIPLERTKILELEAEEQVLMQGLFRIKLQGDRELFAALKLESEARAIKVRFYKEQLGCSVADPEEARVKGPLDFVLERVDYGGGTSIKVHQMGLFQQIDTSHNGRLVIYQLCGGQSWPRTAASIVDRICQIFDVRYHDLLSILVWPCMTSDTRLEGEVSVRLTFTNRQMLQDMIETLKWRGESFHRFFRKQSYMAAGVPIPLRPPQHSPYNGRWSHPLNRA